MSKIIIFNKENILIAKLEGKIEDKEKLKVAKFKEYRLIKSNTIQKLLRKIEKVVKYHKKKESKNYEDDK